MLPTSFRWKRKWKPKEEYNWNDKYAGKYCCHLKFQQNDKLKHLNLLNIHSCTCFFSRHSTWYAAFPNNFSRFTIWVPRFFTITVDCEDMPQEDYCSAAIVTPRGSFLHKSHCWISLVFDWNLARQIHILNNSKA